MFFSLNHDATIVKVTDTRPIYERYQHEVGQVVWAPSHSACGAGQGYCQTPSHFQALTIGPEPRPLDQVELTGAVCDQEGNPTGQSVTFRVGEATFLPCHEARIDGQTRTVWGEDVAEALGLGYQTDTDGRVYRHGVAVGTVALAG